MIEANKLSDEINTETENSEVKKLQWHAPFRSAMKLDLKADADRLEFHDEYNIGTKPVQVDLLVYVIEDKGNGEFVSEIGRIFRKMNLMEYKSPGDSLGETEYYKVMSYAYGFISLDSGLGHGCKPSEVSLSLVREERPVKLLQTLTGKKIKEIKPAFPGIYHIENHQPFPIQIIVTSELSEENHIWLKSLTRRLTEKRASDLLKAFGTLDTGKDKILGNSVVNLAIGANHHIFESLGKEAKDMLEGLRFWYEPEMDQIKANTIIDMSMDFKLSKHDIIEKLINKMPCDRDAANGYLDMYNKNHVVAQTAQ